jgi:hypothetical protein
MQPFIVNELIWTYCDAQVIKTKVHVELGVLNLRKVYWGT